MNNIDRSKQLGEERIIKLIFKFSIPAIIGMLVNALYNIVDRIYIGHGVGSLGIGGITVSFPIMLILMAFSMLIGIGANSLVAIRFGQGRKEEAEGIFNNAFVLFIIASLSLSIIGLIFKEPFLRLMGTSDQIMPYAIEYLEIILLGSVFQSIGMGMNNFIRSEGNPRIAMNTMLIGAITNIVLDPIFIFVFNWGMRGAAIATVISQIVSATWVLLYFMRSKSLLKLKVSYMKLKPAYVGKILALGTAPFAMQIASSILNFIMNKGLNTYGGDVAVSGMGIVNSVVTLLIMPIFGINQGMQPIIGYNYGARKYDRVKQAYYIGVIFATIIVIIGWIVTRVFPEQLVYLFNKEDKELISFGVRAIRRNLMFLPVIGFQIVSSNYFQAVGKPKHSALLGLSRQVLILIPALLILPLYFGLDGLISAGPLSDVTSSILTGIFIILEMRKLNRLNKETTVTLSNLEY
jgi:putative MATE family efflux protein